MKNERLLKVVKILRDAGYNRIREHHIDQKNIDRPVFHLEYYAGPKGVVIVQWEGDGKDGVIAYADWPLGTTFDQLKDALKSLTLEEQNVGDDLCDRCMRSGIVVDHIDKNGDTVCLECAEE